MIIDLTGDDDVEMVAPPAAFSAKRVKTEIGGAVKRESFKGKAAASAPDTDELVIVERVQPVVRPVQPHGDTDEVMVTGEVGQNAARDLPHQRARCVVHQFIKVALDKSTSSNAQYPNPSNAAHCDNCYCYVCDLPAKECKAWRTKPDGEHYGFHCDATPDDAVWRARHMQKRKLNTPVGGRVGVPTLENIFGRRPGGLHPDEDGYDSEGYDSEGYPYGYDEYPDDFANEYGMPYGGYAPNHRPQPPARPPLVITAGTDPEGDVHMMKLGELTIDFVLQKPATHGVDQLKALLHPHLPLTAKGDYHGYAEGKAATQWHDKKMTVADLFQKKEKIPYDGTYTYTFAKPVVPRLVDKCPSHLPVRMLLLAGSGEHTPSFICINLPRKNLKVKGVLQEIAKVLPVPLAEDQVLALTTFRCPDKPDELGASISLPLEVDSPLNINNYLPSSQSVLTCFRVKGTRAEGEVWDTNQKEVEYIVMRHRFKTPLRPDQVARYGGANKAAYCEAVGLPMYYTDIQTPKDTRTVTPTGNLAPETPVYKKAKQEAVAGLQKVVATSMLPFLKAPTHARMAAQVREAGSTGVAGVFRSIGVTLQELVQYRGLQSGVVLDKDCHAYPMQKTNAYSHASATRLRCISITWGSKFSFDTAVDRALLGKVEEDEAATKVAREEAVKSAKLLTARKAEKQEFQSMLGELRDSCHIRLTAQGGHVANKDAGSGRKPTATLTLKLFISKYTVSEHQRVPVGPNLNQKQMQLRKHYQTTLAVLDEPAAEDNPLALARRAENAVVRIQKTVSQLAMKLPSAHVFFQRSAKYNANPKGVPQSEYGGYQLRTPADLMKALVSDERDAAEQPPGLNVEMRHYQRQSLSFMLERERDPGGFRGTFWVPLSDPAGQSVVWYSPTWNLAVNNLPPMPAGGFLAEDMGLGKTVVTLALILANPKPALPVPAPAPVAGAKIPTSATLVVCAVSLVGQWISEAKAKLTAGLRIHMYHGQGRIRDVRRLANEFDLVVTTYQTLGTDFSRGNNPLAGLDWHRVVLDEAHSIKEMKSNQSKACCALTSNLRWCCTGTPVNNAADDLLGQLAFLRMAPLTDKMRFRRFTDFSLNALAAAMRHITIRHTKEQSIQGQAVLQLPPKTDDLVAVEFTPEEHEMYAKLHTDAAREFSRLRAMGERVINTSLFKIMSLLLPLRRVCSGGRLSQKDLEVKAGGAGGGEADGAGGDVQRPRGLLPCPDTVECSMCLEAPENPVVTNCEHWFCDACICEHMLTGAANSNKCPMCRGPIKDADLKRPVAAAAAAGAAAAAAPAVVFECQTKLHALVRLLREMREKDDTAKALVFSQFSNTLEWLKTKLTEEGFGYQTVSGSMSLKKRAKAIEAFQKAPPTTVFLLSVRSGAVGINLTAASHVFLLEPCLNPALSDQAVGRAWRMGQTRPVQVHRLYVKGTVEERILDILKQQREGNNGQPAAESATVDYKSAGACGKRRRDNAPIDTAVGSLRADRQKLRLNELDALFSPYLPNQPPLALPTAHAAPANVQSSV